MGVKPAIRVVVCEDDFLVRTEILRILQNKGYEVVGEAVTGKEALTLAQQQRPDVVLMDIKMPELNGLDATRLMQERCPTPVVILTAHESKDLIEEASEAGAGAYLVKPLRSEEVDRALSIAMARHDDLIALKNLNRELTAKNTDLENALAEIKTLREILPICSFCKKIRDDQGYWNQVEQYISARTGTKFSHGVCEECMAKHYPELNLSKKRKDNKE